jgi:DNA mismatch endonuclease (patch repair protein)
MTDVMSEPKRRALMAHIRGANTNPECTLRRALFSRGFRYRINVRNLPGRPDIVFPRSKVAVFVDGCFWHSCPRHRVWPTTRREFWREKLTDNRRRDQRVASALRGRGWLVIRIWEHQIEEDLRAAVEKVTKKLTERTPAFRSGFRLEPTLPQWT